MSEEEPEEPQRNILTDKDVEKGEGDVIDAGLKDGQLYVPIMKWVNQDNWTSGAPASSYHGAFQNLISYVGTCGGSYDKKLIIRVDLNTLKAAKAEEPFKEKEEEHSLKHDDLMKMFIKIVKDIWIEMRAHSHIAPQMTNEPCKKCMVLGAIHSAMTMAGIKGYELSPLFEVQNQATLPNATPPQENMEDYAVDEMMLKKTGGKSK